MTVFVSAPEQARDARVATPADVLVRAADLLEEFGHCKGHPGSKEAGVFCLRGALIEAHYDFFGERLEPMGDGTVIAYERLTGVDWMWNDDPGRTKAEVVAKLREAARVASATANAEAVASEKQAS